MSRPPSLLVFALGSGLILAADGNGEIVFRADVSLVRVDAARLLIQAVRPQVVPAPKVTGF